LEDPQIQQRQWVTFVRDPIDHFLSGYAECGLRINTKKIRKSTIKGSYDQRVRQWLEKCLVLDKMDIGQSCLRHSLPQANFLMSKNGTIYPQLAVVGDLREMPSFLETIVGIPYSASRGEGRVAADNSIKRRYFAAFPDLLSNATLEKICDFIMLDYVLFDFEPPGACHQLREV
jgi:hypothetical protein